MFLSQQSSESIANHLTCEKSSKNPRWKPGFARMVCLRVPYRVLLATFAVKSF